MTSAPRCSVGWHSSLQWLEAQGKRPRWRGSYAAQLLCLLLSQALILSMPAIFDANNSFLLEGTYGWSSTHCAMIMGSVALLGAAGSFLVDKIEAPIMRIAQFTLSAFVLAGVASIALGIIMNAWGYILGTFLQALLATAAFSVCLYSTFRRWMIVRGLLLPTKSSSFMSPQA